MRLSTPRVFAHLRHVLFGCGVFTTLLAASMTQAGPPHRLTVQGVLEDQFGNPVDGNQTVVIRLYTQPTGGVPLASETRQVTLVEGLFNVELDTLGDPDLYRSSGGGNEDWHFGVAVAGEAELLPRLKIGTVPFAHVSTALEGDVETSPGSLLMKSPGLDNNQVAMESDVSSTQLMLTVDDGDDDPEGSYESIVTPGTSSVAIKTKGTGADKNRISSSVYADSTVEVTTLTTAGGGTSGIESKTKPKKGTITVSSMPSPGHTTLVRSSAGEDTATYEVSVETTGDNDPEGDVSTIVTPGTSSVAIKTKGTGADKNRISSSVYADSTVEITTLTTAGGGTGGIESKTKPKKTTVIIHNMPSPGHTTLVRNSASEDTAAYEVSVDTTGDNDPEGEGSMIVTPGTSSVAIKTKGTGADPNRVVSTTYEDSTVQTMSLSTASTGTREINMRNLPTAAVVEAKNYPSPGHTTLTKGSAYADSATFVVSTDTTGDDDPEGDISTSVTPTSSSMAINRKGTGADKNRVSSSVYADSTVEITTLSTAGGASSGIESKTKPKKGTITVSSLPSPGHTTLVRNSASEDSASFEVSVDTTGDNDPEGSVSAHATPRSGALTVEVSGASHQGTFITTTPDSAHVEVSSGSESAISMSTKPTGVGTPGSSSLSLHHTSGGVTGTIQLSTDDFASAMNLIDDGLTTYRVSTSDGMQMMDNSGIAVTVIDRAGNAAFSNSVGVGVASPTHPIEHSSGAHLTAGGTWTNASDSNLKENFEEVDGAELLDQLARLPISRWNYKNEGASARHIGPSAQDFQKTFGVGSDGKSISTIDPSGIALAAIKELELRNQTLTQQNTQLQEVVEALLHRVERLERGSTAR